MSEIDDDLQPKIGKWWQGLTPEEREEWWREGDKVFYGYNVYEIKTLLTDEPPRDLYQLPAKPAPCAQFWWKLLLWLLDDRVYHAHFDVSGSASVYAHVADPIVEEGKKQRIEHDDCRHALIDAALAVQRGEG